MLEKIKTSLRISSSAFDVEINDLIESAKLDLIISGVSATKVNTGTDSLILRAITIYCKANFGFDNPDADRLNESYIMLKQHLSLAGDYKAGESV